MTTLTDPDLIERLDWRYAVKKFDPSHRINDEDWATIEQTLVLSPSSYGLQPYHFVIVTNPQLRAELAEASHDQAQITTCSHLVVFASRTDIDRSDIDRFIARTAKIRQRTPASFANYRDMMVADLVDGPRHAAIADWSARQAYLALGVLLSGAAVLGIDACPMEGFDPPAFDDILGLRPRGLQSVVLCALGYRAIDDAYARAPKVRFSEHELIEHR